MPKEVVLAVKIEPSFSPVRRAGVAAGETAMSGGPNAEPPRLLTNEEEITLRRVAFGQSEVRAMRAKDLERLRKLRLIEPAKDGPRLTAEGRKLFDTLPRPALDRSDRLTDTLNAMGTNRSAPRS